MKKNKFLALLLAMAMALLLTACQINIPGVGTVRINDGSKNDHDTDGSPAGNSYDTSLAQLREEAMDLPSYLFAAAYIGSSAGGPTIWSFPCRSGCARRRRSCVPSIRSSRISPVNGWWAAAAACSAWCPATPMPPLR